MRDNRSSDKVESILEKLSEQLGEPVMKSSQRLLIIIILKINGKMRFYELQSTLGIGKGSLSNHLEKLESNGFIKTKDVLTISGPGKLIELTEKGKEIVDEYSQLMSMIINRNDEKS